MDETRRPGPRLPASSSPSSGGEIDAFLGAAGCLAVREEAPGARLVFALDATASRGPTWRLAREVQAGMFEAAAAVGGLSVQLVYFRGVSECRASRWVADPTDLRALMSAIEVQGGHTQIGRVLTHVRAETAKRPVGALVFVGDAMEEGLDDLCATAGELGLLGVKAFMFREGDDPVAASAFREIARLTGGVALRFDAGAPASLAALLRAAAAYAAGGGSALRRLASTDRDARRLLAAMPS